ncbi:MAG: hypothetical protein KA506_15630 [Steroidobacteraceae bacterium]|nr:hypothetical protein [Steroidobacteraceae bacterium]
MTNPYLEPVAPFWTRVAGIALLVAATSLTAVLGLGIADFATHAASRRALTSSTVVFALILLALCGICWQAGFRLAFDRRGGQPTLFSRPAWFAIGMALTVIGALMAAVIFPARRPTLLDYQVVLSLGALGVWCLVLAFRRRTERRTETTNREGKHDERV